MRVQARYLPAWWRAAIAIGAVLALSLGMVTATAKLSTASSSTGCEAGYQVTHEWNGGFTGEVTVTNTSGSPAEGWTVTWTFPDGQVITGAWNGEYDQSGSSVTVGNAGWNGVVAAGSTAAFGFQATSSGGNSAPGDVACSFGSGGGDPTDEPTEDPTEEPTEDPTDEPTDPPATGGPQGWASQNGGTTGGAGGGTVTVSSGDELLDALGNDGPQTIRVSGTVDIDGMNDVPSDTTIIGLDGARITGGGLDVDGAHNVIIRNIAFSGWDDDAINVQEGSTNVWIDHNSFTDGYDGAVDVKRESDFVTISWNHVYDHRKSMLLGHSDNHTEDQGHLRVTYHHNYFDGSYSRHPRVRFGNPVHVFNNYYVGNDYGVASTQDAGVLVEGNYFDDVEDPTHVGYGSSDDGSIVERDNVFANGSGSPETSGSVNPIPYSYSLDNAQDIPAIVSNGAGPGNI